MRSGRQFYHALILAFLLGSHRGFVALWKVPAEKPIQVFPYRVSALPAADQIALKKGISADTEQELQGLLEDFLS